MYIGTRFKISRETLHMAIRDGVNTQRSIHKLILSPCSSHIGLHLATLKYKFLNTPVSYTHLTLPTIA